MQRSAWIAGSSWHLLRVSDYPSLSEEAVLQQPDAARRTTTVVVMGVSGSGKSTVMRLLARRLGWPAAEGDTFHSPANLRKMQAGTPLTDADRWPWLAAIAAWIGAQETAAHDALVACSALKGSYRDVLRRGHPSVWFVHLVVSRKVLAARLERRRGHYMPASLLDSQLAALEPLGRREPGISLRAEGTARQAADEILSSLAARS